LKYLSLLIPILFLGCGSSSNNQCDSANSNPLYKESWHLTYDTSVSFPTEVSSEAHIHLQKTWEKSLGENIVIAVIDGSFEATHEDLKDNVIDTYNAIDGGSDVSNTTLSPSHGHAVAGLIGALHNALGSLGVAPSAKLLLIKIDFEASDDVDVLKAFDYAMSKEVDIINCSWGTYAMSDAVEAKITQVVESGISVVFAAGNDNRSLDDEGVHDESEHLLVVGVSASNEENKRASYANYGSALSILAPAGSRSFGLITTDETGDKGYNQGNYTNSNFTGTSASAPLVSGSIALMLALDSTLTPLHVKTSLQQNADKIGDVVYNENGFNTYYAHGKLNVDANIE